jgi:hypothetical protein
MAVVTTIAKGYDLDYVWKNVGSARGGRLLHARRRGGGATRPVVGPWRGGAGVRAWAAGRPRAVGPAVR